MASQEDVVRKLQELIDSQSNFQVGRLTSSAGVGGQVTVRLPNGTQVTAKAGSDCVGGDASVFRLEDGSYVAMSGSSAQEVSSQTSTFRKSRQTVSTGDKKYLKVLFSKVENTKTVFYIGGDRGEPVKIHETDSSDGVKAAYISATGHGKDDWVVALALQRASVITIWHITADPSEKKSWADEKQEIFPLLTYNGFGLWTAGTFIAPTMNKTESQSLVGNTKTTITSYSVERPSFVQGSGEVRIVNIDDRQKVKEGGKCYDTILRAGACTSTGKRILVRVINSTKRVRTGTKWYDPFLDAGYFRNYTETPTSPSDIEVPIYSNVPDRTSLVEKDEVICDPPAPRRTEVPCPGSGYGSAPPPPPGTQTMTISGGYNLSTKSFRINNGVYSENLGSIRLEASGSGIFNGDSVIVTTRFTYSYTGLSWTGREETLQCSGRDVVTKVGEGVEQVVSSETRSVCLAAGIGSGDSIYGTYSQLDNDRGEALRLGGQVLSIPAGFLFKATSLNRQSFSGTDFIEKEMSYGGTQVYASAPKYITSLPNLYSGKVLISTKTEEDEYFIIESELGGLKIEETGLAWGKGQSLQEATLQIGFNRKTAAPLFPTTGADGAIDMSVFSLNGVGGLLVNEQIGEGASTYADLANPYMRTISVDASQFDWVSDYANYRLNVVRSLGNPQHVFYDNRKIMVSPYPVQDAGFCSQRAEAYCLVGEFKSDGSFAWGKPESRWSYSLGRQEGEEGFVLYSTSTWF